MLTWLSLFVAIALGSLMGILLTLLGPGVEHMCPPPAAAFLRIFCKYMYEWVEKKQSEFGEGGNALFTPSSCLVLLKRNGVGQKYLNFIRGAFLSWRPL